MKHVTITFDYEGAWGMPASHKYDLTAATDRLLKLLDRYDAKAVFFVTGKLVEQYPDCIRSIHSRGHEIGMHGYAHEHMHELSPDGVAQLNQRLIAASTAIEAITGYKPKGFRAPYLMGPIFYDANVYQMLAKLGFSWASNREIRQPEELFRPDRLKIGSGLLKLAVFRKPLLVLLNLNLVFNDNPGKGSGVMSSLRWLVSRKQPPFSRPEALTEYPLTSPLDCDLFGFPSPQTVSGLKITAYAAKTIQACFDLSGDFFNINSHDWITGTMDRTQVLDDVLKYITTKEAVVFFRPGLDGEQL